MARTILFITNQTLNGNQLTYVRDYVFRVGTAILILVFVIFVPKYLYYISKFYLFFNFRMNNKFNVIMSLLVIIKQTWAIE